MHRKSVVLILGLFASLLYMGMSPSQAVDSSLWRIDGINSVGCNSGNWDFNVTFSGLDNSGGYVSHTMVTSGGKVYMNEDAGSPSGPNGPTTWGLYSSSSYGPAPGVWPLTPGQQMKAVFTIERPKGTILSSWTLVAASCDSRTLRYSGPTSDDVDGDLVPIPEDKCPTLAAYTANGCPMRARSLSLSVGAARTLMGQLRSPAAPKLAAHRTVYIWKVGVAKKLRTLTTDGTGHFHTTVGAGRYYATAPDTVVATVGDGSAARSRTVRVS